MKLIKIHVGWGNQLDSRLGEDKGTKKMMIVGLD